MGGGIQHYEATSLFKYFLLVVLPPYQFSWIFLKCQWLNASDTSKGTHVFMSF
jgi:hypothetical protein